jgi:hypothetical protein
MEQSKHVHLKLSNQRNTGIRTEIDIEHDGESDHKTNSNQHPNTNQITNKWNPILYSRQQLKRNELLSIEQPQIPTVLVDM